MWFGREGFFGRLRGVLWPQAPRPASSETRGTHATGQPAAPDILTPFLPREGAAVVDLARYRQARG